MTAAALERNTPPPSAVDAVARALLRKRRAMERAAVPELPPGSTLADHERARLEAANRLIGARPSWLSLLDDPQQLRQLASTAAAQLELEAQAGTQRASERANLSIRDRLAELRELEPERPWREPVALSRQQTSYASALRAARAPYEAEPIDSEALKLAEAARGVAGKLRNLRKKREALRATIRTHSLQPRLQKCGQVILAHSDSVAISIGEYGAHFSGLMACGSVWSCPCCAPKIARERQGMVDQLLRRHLQRHSSGVPSDELESGGALFLTLTISHRWGDDLRAMRTKVGLVHRQMWSGRAGKELRARWGIVGHVRSLEVTHGMNGWHPHLHCIIVTEGLLSDAEVESLRLELARRWCDLAEKMDLTRPLEEQQHAESIHSPHDAARYIAKFGESSELTGASNKQGREGGRTPFQILADCLDIERRIARALNTEQPVPPELRRALRHNVRLWRTWERDIKGARFLTWSKGLKARYTITERTDEEIAQAKEGATRPQIIINRSLFQSIAHRAYLRAELLETAEQHGGMAVAELLESLPDLIPGSRVLVVYDSSALDRFSAGERSGPEGGVTLAPKSPQCILYEARLLPSRTITDLLDKPAARQGAE